MAQTLRDRLWLWGHPAGSHNGQYGLTGTSTISPAAAADELMVPNLLMVTYGGKPEPPFDPEARTMAGLDRVVWSIVGDASSRRHDERTDVQEVIALAAGHRNICGAIMDDFFHPPDERGEIGRYGVAELAAFRRQLRAAARPLDLWVVLYTHQLELPVSDHLAQCDVISLWTWKAADLVQLETNFARLCDLAPDHRKVIGCYLWDYGAGRPIPLALWDHQCRLCRSWLAQGRIEGMIFLASCICDLPLETVAAAQRFAADASEILL